jgi:hypothetical protein
MAKGGLALMLEGVKSGGSDKEEAAQDLIDAIKDGDAKSVSLALERHYELCASGSSDDEDEDEAEETEEGTYGG